MRNSSYCLRTRLLLSALFVAATVFSACGGDNSKIVSNQDTGSTNNNNPDTGDNDPDTGAPDTDDTDTDAGVPDTSDPDTGPDDPCLETTPAEAATFADNYAQTVCERVFECNQNPQLALYVSFRDWTSIENCKADVLAGGISTGQAQAAAENGTLTLNSCDAETCLPSLATASCGGLFRILDENYVDEFAECYSAWTGSVAENASCTVDAQCEGRQVCSRDDAPNSCTGVCVDAGLSGSGQCGDNTCRADQYCSGENDICMTRPDTGESCDETTPCRANAICEGGTCAEIDFALTEGEACNVNNNLCDFDLVCRGNVCSEAVGVGETCNSIIDCQGGLYCSEDKECVAFTTAGEACTESAECRSNRCVDGSCTDSESLCP